MPPETLRALVIDDEPAIRHMLVAVMSRAGWAVRDVPTAEDALELLAFEQFDALLIDKNLPGIDGVELVRRVRQTDGTTVCAMITGYANTDSAKETLNLGIDAYIQKPLANVTALADRIRELVSTRRGRQLEPAAPVSSAVNAVIVSTNAAVVGEVADLLRAHELPVVETVAVDAAVAETIADKAPQLVVFDGATAAAAIISGLNATPRPPAYVVLTSADTPLAEVVGYIDLGVKALVEMPIDPRQFAAALANLLDDL